MPGLPRDSRRGQDLDFRSRRIAILATNPGTPPGQVIGFVSHDLATVATIADRVIVMYAGRVCEHGPTREVFSPPYHPYTDLLISSVPELRTDWLTDVLETREGVSAGRGSFPVDAGCAFRTRCAFAIDGTCNTRTPPARRLDEALDHVVYCHHDVAATA